MTKEKKIPQSRISALRFTYTYNTVKSIYERQRKKSYCYIALAALLVLAFYKMIFLKVVGIDCYNAAYRMHLAMILYYAIIAVVIIMSCMYARDRMYYYSLVTLLSEEGSFDTDYHFASLVMFVVGLYSILEYEDIFYDWSLNANIVFRITLVTIPVVIYLIMRHFVYKKCCIWLKLEKEYRKLFDLSDAELEQRYVEITAANKDKDFWASKERCGHWKRTQPTKKSKTWYLDRWYGWLTTTDMQFLDELLHIDIKTK